MGKAEKVKGVGSVALAFCVFSFISTEAEHAGFLRMQLQIELREPLPHGLHYVQSIIKVLHQDHKIICIADQMTCPADPLSGCFFSNHRSST